MLRREELVRKARIAVEEGHVDGDDMPVYVKSAFVDCAARDCRGRPAIVATYEVLYKDVPVRVLYQKTTVQGVSTYAVVIYPLSDEPYVQSLAS